MKKYLNLKKYILAQKSQKNTDGLLLATSAANSGENVSLASNVPSSDVDIQAARPLELNIRFGSEYLRSPAGFCLRNKGQEIVVCNMYKNRISVYDDAGYLVSNIGGGGLLR